MSFAWIALGLVIVLGVVGQLALKYALQKGRARRSSGLLASPGLLVWLFCYGASTLLWLVSLRTVPLSQAFPILGAQFALIPVAAACFLDESVTRTQWVGIIVIVLGVALVGQS